MLENNQSEHWIAEHVRLTAFMLLPAVDSANRWWTEVLGIEPESETVQKKAGLYRAEGPFGQARLTLEVGANKVNWILNSSNDLNAWPSSFPAVGYFPSSAVEFLSLMKRWLNHELQIQRLAIGVRLILPGENRDQTYDTISKYLHNVKVDKENSRDLIYQINRPRDCPYAHGSMSINRLCKWATVLLKSIGRLQDEEAGHILSEVHACLVELDINTDADSEGSIPRESLPGILDTLGRFGIEIAERGDVP